MLFGDHVACGQHLEVFLQQRMGRNRAAHRHRRLDLALNELETFQFHLPAAHIQAGNDLVIRAGRGMGHIGFMEALLDLALEVLIVDMDHRALPQRLVSVLCVDCGAVHPAHAPFGGGISRVYRAMFSSSAPFKLGRAAPS